MGPAQMLQRTFGSKKPIIAMIHLAPLPGAPLYDRDGGMQRIIDLAAADIEALQDGGVDAVMFGNEGDRPYLLEASPQSLAAMAFAVGELKRLIRVPFGVNYLWDPIATISLAVASGAGFAREIFTGVYESDMGLWQPDAATALRLKADLGRPDLTLMFNINAEFASPLGSRGIAARARSAVFSSLADVVLVSGPMTGQGVETADLTIVKEAVPGTPVFANTGVTIDTVADILKIGDGAVVGTHFKIDGNTWNAVDRDRVKRFMEKVRKLRDRAAR
jgi:membrane complex biogenesis BtpA family protein